MITYEITATVDPEVVPAYEQYMRTQHIPDLLATGCFVAATFAHADGGRYRIRYEAPDQATLDHYFADYAAQLRAHVEAHFPVGVALAREQWVVIQRWPETQARAAHGDGEVSHRAA
jgi:hypothetical protein